MRLLVKLLNKLESFRKVEGAKVDNRIRKKIKKIEEENLQADWIFLRKKY